MQSPRFFLPGVVVLLLGLGCSSAADDGDPLWSGGSGSVATAGSAGAGLSSSGAGSGVGGANATAGTTSQGGLPSGTSGASAGGVSSQGGVAQGGAAQGGAAQGGAGGAVAVPTDGKGLYDLNCSKCHLEQGAGSPLAPAIVHPVRDYSNWVVRNGRPLIAPWTKAMEKFGTDKLSDAQLTLIWNYLDEPPQPTTGAALFGDYCANCHGANGEGGPTMRKLAGEGKNVLKLVREGKSVGQYAMRHDSMPKFDTMRITDAELNLILAHVNTF